MVAYNRAPLLSTELPDLIDANSQDRFASIRPYYDNEVRGVLDRLLNHDELLDVMARLRFRWMPTWLRVLVRPLVRSRLSTQLAGVDSVLAFQSVVEGYMTAMIESHTSAFTVSGLSNIHSAKANLFIGNHRDIALDPAFLNYALYQNKLDTVRIAIGDNLVTRDYVADLMRLNKSFIVKRSVKGPRQMLAAYKELSDYIRYSLIDENSPVWIAQREGRAKDGWDRTEPAIVKMICMSKDKTQSLSEHVESLAITPISISYEWDPCDAAKARELYLKESEGKYEKAENEDVASIGLSIRGEKGAVHVSFGTPLSGEFEDADDVARAIDKQVLELYQLHASNLAAWKRLNGSLPDGHSATADLDVADAELQRRLDAIPEPHRPYMLAMYANPVDNLRAFRAELAAAC